MAPMAALAPARPPVEVLGLVELGAAADARHAHDGLPAVLGLPVLSPAPGSRAQLGGRPDRQARLVLLGWPNSYRGTPSIASLWERL